MNAAERSTTPASHRTLAAVACLLACLLPAACGRGDDLWARRFDAPSTTSRPATGAAPLTGYWQGEVFSGAIRLRIEPATVTLALKCDEAGRKLAQGSARIAVDGGALILQEDLAGGDADCGFKFLKGDRLTARSSGPGTLDVAFGNASVSKLARLADLSGAN